MTFVLKKIILSQIKMDNYPHLDFNEEELADALMQDVDLNAISDDLVLRMLAEDRENVRELLDGKLFPFDRISIQEFLLELVNEDVFAAENAIFDHEKVSWNVEEVIDLVQKIALFCLQRK